MANNRYEFPNLIGIPEVECPHCHASLANRYEQCTCPGSQAS